MAARIRTGRIDKAITLYDVRPLSAADAKELARALIAAADVLDQLL